jgi:hypothetical protein
MEIIFYEDLAQLEKLLSHVPCKNYIAIKYIGKKIHSICRVIDGDWAECNVFYLILKSLLANKIVCEYANGLPRLWAAIFGKKLESHIFGILDRSDFAFASVHKIKIARKILNKLYADEYIIYGVKNPTQDLIDEIRLYFNSKAMVARRRDLSLHPKMGPEPTWAVYIAQPWRELGNITNEQIQLALYQAMKSRLPNVYYCKHPRQLADNFDESMVINGWLELKERMKIHGLPAIAVSINSSLVYELQEMAVNAVNIAHRVNGQTVFPEMSVALERICSEISHIGYEVPSKS